MSKSVSLTALLVAVLPVFGCGRESGESAAHDGHCAPSEAPENFDLVCDSSETDARALTFCFRIDTRNGEVLKIDVDNIPRTNGPTKSAELAAGAYKLVCNSADTASTADLSCLRLNAESGEVLLIALPKVGTLPE